MDRRRRFFLTVLTSEIQFSKGKMLIYDVKSQKKALRGFNRKTKKKAIVPYFTKNMVKITLFH